MFAAAETERSASGSSAYHPEQPIMSVVDRQRTASVSGDSYGLR